MDENIKMKVKKGLSILKWMVIGIVAAFVVAVIVRIPHAIQENKIDAQILKIHATKLAMDDVMGVNLPPYPGAEADKTIAGVDVNKNGIRDDVELAIFKTTLDEHIRVAQLQFARAIQVRLTTDSTNGDIELSTFRLPDYGVVCIRNIFAPLYIKAQEEAGLPYDWEKVRPLREVVRNREEAAVNLVQDAMLNTEARKKKFKERSIENPTTYNQSYPVHICDIDDKNLLN